MLVIVFYVRPRQRTLEDLREISALCNFVDGASVSVRGTYFQPKLSRKLTMTETAECMSESRSCSTFAHPLVLAQNVACGTFALVRAHHVNTAEGAQ